jgi:hypothetical protein
MRCDIFKTMSYRKAIERDKRYTFERTKFRRNNSKKISLPLQKTL